MSFVVAVVLLAGAVGARAASWEVIASHGVGDGGPALSAPIGSPGAVAVDGTGKLYIAVSRQARIRMVEGGRIFTLTGTGATAYNGDGIPAVAAHINYPTGITVGPDGTVYFIDQNNHRVRAVGADGIIRTVAGDGRQGFGGDGGPATAARLNYTSGIALDPSGNLYLADTGNHRVRRVTPDGRIDTVAGTGEPGFGGDGGPAAAALLRYPLFLASDGLGALYVFDSGSRTVRRIGPEGGISATGIEGLVDGLAADGDGTLYVSQYGGIWRWRQGHPEMIAGRGTGRLGGNPALEHVVGQPGSLAVDPAGTLFVADPERYVVVTIDPAGVVERVAGNGTSARYGDGGPANGASFACGDLVVAADGTIVFGDPANDRIAAVRPDGRIDTFGASGRAGISGPAGLAMDTEGSVYVADFGHNRVLKFDAGGGVTTVAGTGEQGFAGDEGPASAAMLDGPGGLALDSAGRLYVSDTRNRRVRRVDADGTIATVAGNGDDGEPPEGAVAVAAPLGRPAGLAVTVGGDVLVAVPAARAVRRITAGGVVFTHRSAEDVAPVDIALRPGTNPFVSSYLGPSLLRLDQEGALAPAAVGDAPSDPVQLGGMAFDPAGEWVYACDQGNRRLLRARW